MNRRSSHCRLLRSLLALALVTPVSLHAQQRYHFFDDVWLPNSALQAAVGIPDIDGDEVSEFAVTRRYHRNGYERAVVNIYSGADQKLIRVIHHDGEHSWEEDFGWALGSGDIDGDGVDELLVGWPSREAIVPYDVETWEKKPFYHWRSPTHGFLGSRLASGFDVDGDGCEDVVAGAPGAINEKGDYNAGAALLFSGRTGEVLWEYGETQVGEGFPYGGVAVLDDADGDGVTDFLFGSPHYGFSDLGSGRVVLISGRTGQVVEEWFGDEKEVNFGVAVFSFGDLNGDGLSDFGADTFRELDWLGNRHVLNVYHAGRHKPVIQIRERLSGQRYMSWTPAKTVQDMDGDHRRDLGMIVTYEPYQERPESHGLFFSSRTGELLWHWREKPGGRRFWVVANLFEIGDLTGDGQNEMLLLSKNKNDQPRSLHVYSRPSVLYGELEATTRKHEVELFVPGHAGGLFQVFASSSRKDGILIGRRRLPLDPGPLFEWSRELFVHGYLDAEGRALVDLHPLLGPDSDPAGSPQVFVAWLGYDSTYPDNVRVISNALKIEH